MSERYGKCTPCAGLGCLACSGSGFSGDALAYLESQTLEERQREPKGGWSLREQNPAFVKAEELFYANPKRTTALEAAVFAVENFKNWDKKAAMSSNIIPFLAVKAELERKRNMSQSLETNAPAKELVPHAPATDMSNPFSSLANFEAAQRMAKALSLSTLIPKEYQNNIPNCLIALEISQRLRASALMVMQNLYIVHGKPGWSAQYIISAINSCGKFSPLRFKLDAENTECTAYAIELRTNETLHGTKITMGMAKKEGWLSRKDKNGNETSKWQSMPEQMLRYRAASFFGKIYAPEILMGFQTTEEIEDMTSFSAAKEVKQVPSQSQITRLYTIAGNSGLKHDQVHELIHSQFGKSSSKDLTIEEYYNLVAVLQEYEKPAVPIENSQISENSENLAKAILPEPGSDAEEDPVEGVAKDVPWAKYREQHTS